MNSNATLALPALRRSSLASNITAMYTLQIANYVIPLVTLPYLIRALGAEQYGVMAMAYAVVFFMVLFVDAGFNTIATRRLARPGIDIAAVSEIYVTTQVIKLAQCALMALLLAGLVATVPAMAASAPVYYATFPIVLGSLLFPTWLFQGLQNMHFTLLCSVSGRLLATVGIFVLVKDPGDVLLAALLQASATAISGLMSLPLVFRRLGVRLDVTRGRLGRLTRRMLADARSFAPAEYLTNAIGNSAVFVLGLFAGSTMVGVFAAIEKIARAGAGLFQPLTKALFPALSGRWIGHAADAAGYGRRWTLRILVLAGMSAAALFAAAPAALEILFGPEWSAHAGYLRLFSLWLVAHVTATVLGKFWLLARGMQSAYSFGLLLAGAVQLAASVIGAWRYGAAGLVTAIACAELARIVIFLIAIRRGRTGVL